MYVFYLDDEILYYPGDSECMIMDPEINLALNEAGSCEFRLPVENPYYNELHLRQSMIRAVRDGAEVFCGEVRECPKDGDRVRKVYVVGELAFLHNSRQPQRVYGEITPYAFLNALLQVHNAQTEERQHFTIGTVTVSNGFNPIYFTTDHGDTLDVIRTMLIDNLGGVLRIRKQNGTRYLDYITIAEYGNYNTQGITFGENLMDYAEDYSANNVVTAVIPRGAVIEGADSEFQKHVDITSVTPNGEDFLINQIAANSYGYIWEVVDFPGIDDPQDLYDAAEQWLTDNQYDDLELTLTAADQSALDVNITAFKLGDRVPVYAEPYGMNKTFPVKTQTLYPQAPQNERLKLSANLRRKSTYTSYAAASATVTSASEKQERLTIQKLIMQEISNVIAQFTGTNGGYKISEYNADGKWMRDLIMDAPDPANALKVLEISVEGIRGTDVGIATADAQNKWKSAITIDGKFVADRILVGTLTAAIIKAGILSDINNNFSLNLETGAISAKNMSIDSTNFDLDSSGNMTATSATLNDVTVTGGTISTVSGTKKMTMKNGVIEGYIGNARQSLIDISPNYAGNHKVLALYGMDFLELQAGPLQNGAPQMRIVVDKDGIHPQGSTGQLTIGDTTLTLDGGLITAASLSNPSGLTGNISFPGGSLTLNNGMVTGSSASSGSSGTVNIAGGSITYSDGLVTGGTSASGASGTVNIAGGSLTISNGLVTGGSSSQSGMSGTVYIGDLQFNFSNGLLTSVTYPTGETQSKGLTGQTVIGGTTVVLDGGIITDIL